MGDTLAKSLISTVKNRNATSMEDLMFKLAQYEKRCLEVGDPMAKQNTADRFDCIRYILRSCSRIEEFEPTIRTLLSPPKGSKFFSLSTVHKAKGLESRVIGVLNPPVPSSKATTEVQKQQEINCDFVAQTRSKQDMFYLYAQDF
jgi:superfamily I DNA/RNA helicase